MNPEGKYTVSFLREDDAVVLVVNGKRVCTQGWAGALDTCRELDLQLRNITKQGMNPATAPIGETGVQVGSVGLHFRQEQDKILVLGGNPERLLFDMNTAPTENGGPSIARQVWSSWVRATREAELYSRSPKGGLVAEHVARDAAILHRSGAPVGLTDHPLIQKVAQGLARDDRQVRQMPDKRQSVRSNGIVSDEVLGTPRLVMGGSSTPFQRAGALLSSMPADLRRVVLTGLTEKNP